MSEERLAALESHVTDVRIDNARINESIDHLAATVADLALSVKNLTGYMERGKGALWVFGIMSATAGGLISWATTLLFRP
jgi:hypothetical protein